MSHEELKTTLYRSGIKISDDHVDRIKQLMDSGKMNLKSIKKCMLPEIPEHLVDMSLDVMGQLDIHL